MAEATENFSWMEVLDKTIRVLPSSIKMLSLSRDDLLLIKPDDIEARAQALYKEWWGSLCDTLKMCLSSNSTQELKGLLR